MNELVIDNLIVKVGIWRYFNTTYQSFSVFSSLDSVMALGRIVDETGFPLYS